MSYMEEEFPSHKSLEFSSKLNGIVHASWVLLITTLKKQRFDYAQLQQNKRFINEMKFTGKEFIRYIQ